MMVMLVTSEGLTDPRIVRSMHAARRAGFGIRLVCRSRADGHEEQAAPEGTHLHRVARLPGLRGLKRAFAGRSAASETGRESGAVSPRTAGPFWFRPWELWILGGIAWFTWQAVMKVRRFPADLYHANDLDTLPAGVILSRLKRVPLLYDAHELYADQFGGASRQFRAILFGLEHRLIRFAHRVVTVNRSLAETLTAWHAVPLPSIVMNCPFAPDPRRNGTGALRAPHGASPGRAARVIYQGIFWRDRGLEELIRSAAWYESAELYLRGYGDLEPALRALVKAEGLEARVHFLPPVAPDRLVESLAGFDVGVVPYRPTNLNNRFCLPNKVFEYLQAGLALAASALPELERVVKETGVGELFDPEQPHDIARAINILTRDAGRLADLQGRARILGRERYTWEARGEPSLLACYRELTEPVSAAPEVGH